MIRLLPVGRDRSLNRSQGANLSRRSSRLNTDRAFRCQSDVLAAKQGQYVTRDREEVCASSIHPGALFVCDVSGTGGIGWPSLATD